MRVSDPSMSRVQRAAATLARFRRAQSGSLATTFALSLVPISIAIGAAVDYSFANNARSHLNAVADAAALSAVASSAMSMTAGEAEKAAKKFFEAQALNIKRVTVKSVGVKVTQNKKNGRVVVVDYTATTPAAFLGLISIKTLNIAGDSTAAAATPTYIDFYLLLDNTPSMGLGATTNDINKLVANTPDKCGFACHEVNAAPNDYYGLAKKLGVEMRIDVVRKATQKLMDTAADTATVPSQFRAAIYTFGASCTSLGATQVAKLTANLSTVKADAKHIDLMTIPYQGYNNDQCTDSDQAFKILGGAMGKGGSGKTALEPQKVLFLVTDGVADMVKPNGCAKPVTGGTRCQEPMDVAQCAAMKKNGVKIAVLYTTYLPLPTNSWYKTWIAPFQTEIGKNMEKCASPGLFFEVSPTQGIEEAMIALFKKVVGKARLTS
jgi:Flp pilus assembly protein TadG